MVMSIYGNAPTTAHVVTLPLVAQKSKLTHGNQDSQSNSICFCFFSRYDGEKRTALKAEKAKKDALASKQEQDRKDLEERLAKAQINFERAAIESKKKMARLEEENERAKGAVQVVRLNFRHLLRLLMLQLLWLLLLL